MDIHDFNITPQPTDSDYSTELNTGKNYTIPGGNDNENLPGMFRNWYLDYASYVILERAVPHIEDGLKPVQRRILHTMQTLDDGRFNKVANIVGSTMAYHPHGDASIGAALVQLGQKNLLIDTQGNWGNIITGDEASAPRYIEARLSPFALETLFSPKITEWTKSYDGRKDEPVTLPVKFPLLLAQGVEGIAVGLSSKILPHNFNEIINAAIDALHQREFTLLPDFQTGGQMDASRYNDGRRGGNIRVRAKIEKIDNKTLSITEIPFGKTTATVISSILSAMEKGKIKIRKVDDITSGEAMILVHLQPGTSSDKAIDALYAFTDCEISISPNCCVILDSKPAFMGVSDLLRHSVDNTLQLLQRELQIKLSEKKEEQYFLSLEKIFITERMYKDEQIELAREMEKVTSHLHTRFQPWKPLLYRTLTDDDMLRLWEIRMKRILSFNSRRAEEKIAEITAEINEIEYNLAHIREYTEKWYIHLRDTYGAAFPRRTSIRNFENIEASKVAEANKRLYYDKAGGFLGTALKDAEFKCLCSDIDDILIVNSDGTYKIVRTPEKLFVGKKVEHVAKFNKNDKRTVYNVVYRNGRLGDTDEKGKPAGWVFKKRFFITGLTRDKEYSITQGLPGSTMLYFTANPNGEAEMARAIIKPSKDTLDFRTEKRGRKKNADTDIYINFAELAIKNKESLGNLVTKEDVAKVVFDHTLGSTLGGREVWFDFDVMRINYDGRGQSLGIFQGSDKVLVILKNGEYYTTTFSDDQHFDEPIDRIERFDKHKIWTLALFDPEAGYAYLKRFNLEPSSRKQRFAGINEKAKIYLLTDTVAPLLEVEFGAHDRHRLPLEIDAEEFIGVKSFKAKGKRISTFKVRDVKEIGAKEPATPEETPSSPPESTAPQPESTTSQPFTDSLFADEDLD